MGAVIHVTDDVNHLAVACASLEQARRYAQQYHGPLHGLMQSTIAQLCAWIEFTEDEEYPA